MSNFSLDQAKRKIGERVELFARNREQYRAPEYKEARLRTEFLDPFFEALGWDVGNQQGSSEVYKEVISEDAIKIGDSTRAPDYSFRVGGARKFFAEAKKPQLALKTDASAAFQLRRYAWTVKLPLSILSDFEEFAIYDCRARPSVADKASAGRINFFKFDEYVDRLPEIFDLFSRDAVLRGSLDQYAQNKGKRGTQPVDAEFLKEIESWRATLAKNIASLNPRLTLDDMNDSVQRTIDRIIFLRMAEDRGAEDYGRLQTLTAPTPSRPRSQDQRTGEGVYGRFLKLCHDADDKYNSGLFDFKSDTLTASLKIDDDKLGSIFESLYFPQSPYVFRELAEDTLGNVYEQFLGKVIHLTPSHQAKIDEKPAVKKAGGVYYTPKYIVDYIAKQTLGKLIAGKSPDELAGLSPRVRPDGRPQGSPLRVLDPACGSGSFLLGAFQLLLEHHLNWYTANRTHKSARNTIYESAKGWRLTTAEKKRILTTHIFGVDIDRQAVEVTKLSLLLKVLEDETQETLGKQLALFKERALPNLDANIKCGNSLIGADYFAEQLMPDKDELRRVNPFDWAREFPEVLAPTSALTLPRSQNRRTGEGTERPPLSVNDPTGEGRDGGFDVIIGNPPYVRIQVMKEWAPLEVEIYKEKYAAASSGNYDIYVVFVERALQLLNANGRMGFILPHKFFNAQYGEPLRELIARGKHLAKVVHFGDQQIFADATTYTCLMFLDKQGRDECEFTKVDDLTAWRNEGQATEGTIPATSITRAEWNFAVGKSAALFERLSKMPVKLGDVADLFVGLQTDADDVYILEEVHREKKRVLCESKATGQQHWFEDGHLKPFLKGSLNIRRYFLDDLTKRLIFPYEIQNGKSVLIDAKEYKQRYPLTWAYLETNKDRLTKRNKGQMGKDWYGYVYRKNHTRFGASKLLVPSLAFGSCFAADLDGKFYFVGSGGGGGGGYGIEMLPHITFSYLYLLGVLNSNLISGFLKSISTPFQGGYFALNRQYIVQLPIRTINFADAADKARHDRIVALVTQMLELHPRLRAAQTAADREMIQRQIDATDKEIDTVVYELYGVTEEERKVVEGR